MHFVSLNIVLSICDTCSLDLNIHLVFSEAGIWVVLTLFLSDGGGSAAVSLRSSSGSGHQLYTGNPRPLCFLRHTRTAQRPRGEFLCWIIYFSLTWWLYMSSVSNVIILNGRAGVLYLMTRRLIICSSTELFCFLCV